MTELFFLIVLFVIIVEVNFDLGFVFAIIIMLCVILDCIFAKHNFVILNYANQTKFYKNYILILVLQIIMTLIALPFEYSESMLYGIKTFFANSILLLIVNGYFLFYLKIKRFFECFRILGVCIACLGAMETIVQRNILPLQIGNYNINSFGTEYFRTVLFFGQPTIAAIFFVIVITTLLYIPLKNKSFQIFSLLILFYALYGTRTRIMWLCVILILFLYWSDQIFNKKIVIDKKKIICLGLIAITLIVLIIYFAARLINIYKDLEQYILLMFDQNNNYGSRIVRMTNIYNAVDYWKKNPIFFLIGQGVGYDKVFSINNGVKLDYDKIWNSGVDNQYITLVLQAGIFSALFFIKLIIESIKKFFKTCSREIKIATLYIVIIGIASISMDSFGWRMCVFFLQFGILIINRGMKEKWEE